MKRTDSKRAFTLVELLLSISIIILVAAMIAPMVTAFGGASLSEATRNELKAYLMLARQQAVQYNRPVAVFVLPPTQLTEVSRLMLFELKENPSNLNNIADVNNWRAMAGAYGTKIRRGIVISNNGNVTSPDMFGIVFDASGAIDARCPAQNTTLLISPRNVTESTEQQMAVAINRATGSILDLSRED